MIASLRGRLVAAEPVPVVEVGGLGLAVQVSARTAAGLPSAGEEVRLLTYLHVREDQLALYGFADPQERRVFLALLGVTGIGPRVALALLSSAPLEQLVQAVESGDEAYLTRLPGLGRKTAARLVVELQGKLAPAGAPEGAAQVATSPLFDEAILALASLGMPQRAAREAVEGVDLERLGASPRVEDLVKAALQAGGRRTAP